MRQCADTYAPVFTPDPARTTLRSMAAVKENRNTRRRVQRGKAFHMMTPESIRDKVQSIIQLPALPTIAMEVVELVDNPKTSASRLGK